VKKKFTKRLVRDNSQRIRLAVQLVFLALNVWIGVQFYMWVRYFETNGQTASVTRPPGVEGWLPIAAMMNLKYHVLTGNVPDTHAAGMFILTAFLLISLLLRKAFCSWLCPVGTFSEFLWKLGRQTFRRTYALPRWLDLPLRSLKYILMGLFVYAVAGMNPADIRIFLESPYGAVADVKMLNFFRFLGTGAAVTVGVLVILSIFIQNFWCRYLCPYGALMSLPGILSPLRIRREPSVCIDCAKCAKACPALLPVDKLVQIRSAECTGCLECIAVCPAENALQMSAPGRRSVPAWLMAAAMGVVFLGICGYAQSQGYWHTYVPDAVYFELIPRAAEFSHP
jgi:polyferredoxin